MQLTGKPMTDNLYDLLVSCADTFPESVAISAPERKGLTYRQLLATIQNAANTFRALGIGRNNRIAIVLPNGPEMAAAFLAVTACATSAPLNPFYRAEEFDFYLSDLKAKALIVQSEEDSAAAAVAKRRNIPIIELIPPLQSKEPRIIQPVQQIGRNLNHVTSSFGHIHWEL